MYRRCADNRFLHSSHITPVREGRRDATDGTCTYSEDSTKVTQACLCNDGRVNARSGIAGVSCIAYISRRASLCCCPCRPEVTHAVSSSAPRRRSGSRWWRWTSMVVGRAKSSWGGGMAWSGTVDSARAWRALFGWVALMAPEMALRTAVTIRTSPSYLCMASQATQASLGDFAVTSTRLGFHFVVMVHLAPHLPASCQNKPSVGRSCVSMRVQRRRRHHRQRLPSARRVSPLKETYESYFVRKTADYAHAREWARLGCAWGGTHKRANAFFCPGPAKKHVLGSIFGSAREAAHRRRQTTNIF